MELRSFHTPKLVASRGSRRASEQNGFIPRVLRPVHFAAKGKNIEIVRQLLECRADPEDAIGITCCSGDDRVLDELLKFQVSVYTISMHILVDPKFQASRPE